MDPLIKKYERMLTRMFKFYSKHIKYGSELFDTDDETLKKEMLKIYEDQRSKFCEELKKTGIY